VLFAAALRPLLDQPGVSRALNRAALADHLCLRWPDPHETFFSAVRRVPSGWRAVVSGRRLRLHRSWDPLPEDRPIEWLTAGETARFDEVFDRAVDRCLATGPSAIYLSGGLDSISVAAVAANCARQNGRNLPLALSLGFSDPSYDERVRQAAVARDLGLRQHLVDFDKAIGSRPLLEQSLELNKGLAAPLLNTYEPAFLGLARRARRDGVRTILTGQGGDEWLGLAPLLAADLIRRGAFVEVARLFGALRRSYQLSALALVRNVIWTCGVRPLGGLALHRLIPEIHKTRRRKRLLAGDPIWAIPPDRALRGEQQRRADGALAASDPPQGFYAREMRTGFSHPLVAWEAEERYELGERVGVRFLHPYWDPDLIELLCRIPPRLLNEGGRTKGLVRQTLARRFPELGLERQRKVDITPVFHKLLSSEGPALADAAGDFPALSALGVVDGQATRSFVCEALRQTGPPSYRIWVAFNLEFWVRLNGG
jgi:asparagine synthase (glutamine-hydrolysing)